MEKLLKSVPSRVATRFVKKGTILLYQSEIPRYAFIIKKGVVRSYTITSSGEERIISLHTKDDVFPLTWVYGETANTLFYYEATSDVEVATVNKDDLVKTVMADPDQIKLLLKSTINNYTALLLRITALEQSSAAEKIALTLYYLIIRHGTKRNDGEYTIDIKMTQSMIANLVGLTRESTAVNLKLLKRKKIITYNNFIYVVNKQNLEKFVGEDGFKDVTLD